MREIRAYVVDDEPPARKRIVELLAPEEDVIVAGEFDNGADALRALRDAPADLLFLDVQMPELDGFGVLRELGPALAPVTIFVTAYDRFALKAFEFHALDYLLKPFSDERFAAALTRARASVRTADRAALDEKLEALLQEVSSPAARYLERIVVRNAGRVSFVPASEVDWIEAAGVYVTIHAGENEHLLRESLASLEAKLDPKRFARVHRSAIVALDRVTEIRDEGGRVRVLLSCGAAVRLSRSHRNALEQALGSGGS